MNNDDGSAKIALILLLLIFIAFWEGCRYSIATDEDMPIGEKIYWLDLMG